MAFASINDETGTVDLVFFPKKYEEVRSFLGSDKVIVVKGRVDFSETKMSILVEEAKEFDQNSRDLTGFDTPEPVEIMIPPKTKKEQLKQLNDLLKTNTGDNPVVILLPNGSSTPKRIKLNYGINYTPVLQRKIDLILSFPKTEEQKIDS